MKAVINLCVLGILFFHFTKFHTDYFLESPLFSTVKAAEGMSKSVVSDLALDGKQTFLRYCASCHGVHGTGDGPVSKSLIVQPADISRLKYDNRGKFPIEWVLKTIDGREMPRAHGLSDMPVWGQWFSSQAMAEGVLQDDINGIEKLVRKRLDNLVAYIKTLQK